MGQSSSMAAPVIVNATAKHTATVIFLHGLGDTGHGWCDAFRMMAKPHIKYICPTANTIPVSLNGGMAMPSWFDIFGLDPTARQDEAGIKASSQLLQHFIAEEEKAGIPRGRIAVGGFSQGGAVALYSTLATSQSSLAGIIALSTWMPLHTKLQVKANTETPILQCHGQSDPMVAFSFGKMTGELLSTASTKHQFKSYAGLGHSSSQEEMSDVSDFINTILPPV